MHASELIVHETALSTSAHASGLLARLVVLALTLAMLVLGACGSGAPRPRDDALVVILPREPDQLDPRFVGDAQGLKLTRLIHASLVRMDSETLLPVPDLAQSIEELSPTRYLVRLREGVRFSDGSTLDADDVVATFLALKDPKVQSRYLATYRRVARVEKLDSELVSFELREPHATFLTDLEVPVLRAEDAFLPSDPEHPPIGAGPYELVSRTRSSVELHVNPYHSLAHSSPPHLRFMIMRDDNTRALRLLAGAGDLALNAVPPLLVPLFSHRADFQVRSAPGIGTTYLGVNLTHPVLRDVRVRRALAHALDRESLVRFKLNGRARTASGFVPPGHWAFSDDVAHYPFDRDEARRLLAEAGLAHKLSLTLRTGSDRFMVSMARALAAMLEDVGVSVEVRPSETATLLADLNRGRFEITLLTLPEVFEPHVLSWFFASDRIPEKGREGGNRFRYRSPELDRALELGRAHTDRPTRVAAYHEVQRIMARDLPAIPLWHEDVVAITSRRLADYRVPRDGRFGTLVHRKERP
jgi:peptide/nickel transport system substrate-binding protein